MDSAPLLDRAYDRRQELLSQGDVTWVRMVLDAHGVTLTICYDDGAKDVEFIAMEP